ncbi:flavodoxin [Mesorhizobium waimense]|uniref:Flavodoxin n=1 Tax=Mesorhizobium waimense TaxID=1300307 RepID=A0A3A5KKV5_9HYPH|nr:flavodoxin [Mesorhizobium waimense]RJT33395.1 flavodoxin [Mesorhizobium waimense]
MSSLLLPLAAGSASVTQAEAAPRSDGKSLVAFFSRSGNTRVIAGQLSRALPADLFEIAPATPYPADYFETVERARQERDRGNRPPIKAQLPSTASYATVFLGFPIWGETAPPVIRTFLAVHDLAGKTIIPFITHGGFGLGNSQAVLASHAPQARLMDGFSMQAPQERQTIERVTQWLDTLKVK